MTIVLNLVLQSSLAFAFSFSPMVKEFQPTGKGRSHMFEVNNTTGEKIAVQISAMTRTIDLKGAEKNEDTDKFQIFPSQFTLDADQKRNIRVTWMGGDKLTSEQAFRLLAEQLPISLKKKKPKSTANVKFLLNYKASVYVTPENSQPKVEIKSLQKVGGKLQLVLKNSGNAHQVLKEISLVNKAGKKLAILKPTKDGTGAINLLPTGERSFTSKWPADFGQSTSSSDYKVEFK